MQITEELIKRFLANRCTAEEAESVAIYLATHPDVASYYLQQSWTENDQQESMPAGYSEEMLKVILSETKTKRKFPVIVFRWMGIAASLLLLIGLVWIKQYNQSPFTKQVAAWKPSWSTPPEWVIIENKGKLPINEVLADGSVVTLSPKASLRYPVSFTATRRDLFLKGEALFEVAKDKNRPFTVHEGMFSTTALGTVFRMKETHGNCQVKLYEGKVVIKALQRGIAGWKNDVYLEAGEQMEFDKDKLAINRFVIEKYRTRENLVRLNIAELEFVNKPLDQVFDKLAEQYKLSIEYNKPELEQLYFSGKVLKNDSLETILKVIAQMNGLKIVQKGNGFVVNKLNN